MCLYIVDMDVCAFIVEIDVRRDGCICIYSRGVFNKTPEFACGFLSFIRMDEVSTSWMLNDVVNNINKICFVCRLITQFMVAMVT